MSRALQAAGFVEYSDPQPTAPPQPREPTPTKPIYNTTGHSAHYDTRGAPCDVPQQQRTRPSSAAAHYHHYRPEPRRKSDEYIGYEGPRSGRSSVPADRADRFPSYPETFGPRNATMDAAQLRHRPTQTTAGGRSVQRSQTLPMNFSIPEDRQASGPYASGIVHSTDSIDEYEEHKKEVAKSNERVRKWLERNAQTGRVTPTKRQTADGYEHLRSPNGGQAARLSPTHGRQHYQNYARDDISRRDALGRNHTLPAAFAPVSSNMAEMSNITEEPANMVSVTVPEGEYSDEDVSTDDDDATSERFRPVHHRQKTPLPGQRPHLERSDTLRVEDERSYQQALPSPKSMRHPSSGQSSRIPSARSSYERVGEGGLVSTPNRHHLSPASSQQFQGAMSYNTPPRTPNRPDYMYRQDDSRAPLSAPPAIRSSAHATVGPSSLRHSDRTKASPRIANSQLSPTSFHTPPHLQYLYRSTASPSPQARPAAMAAPAGHQATYSRGLAPGGEALPTRPSRSPSPRPPSHVPQSVGGHHTHGTSSDHVQDHQSAVRSGHGQGRSPLMQRTPLTGRNVRQGFWNRRGDHLTQKDEKKDYFIVSCPPGRNYPSDLAEYPDLGFLDHLGNRISKMPDAFPELPDSIPQKGRPAKRPYETVCPSSSRSYLTSLSTFIRFTVHQLYPDVTYSFKSVARASFLSHLIIYLHNIIVDLHCLSNTPSDQFGHQHV